MRTARFCSSVAGGSRVPGGMVKGALWEGTITPLPVMDVQTRVKHYLPATSFAGGKNSLQILFLAHSCMDGFF